MQKLPIAAYIEATGKGRKLSNKNDLFTGETLGLDQDKAHRLALSLIKMTLFESGGWVALDLRVMGAGSGVAAATPV